MPHHKRGSRKAGSGADLELPHFGSFPTEQPGLKTLSVSYVGAVAPPELQVACC